MTRTIINLDADDKAWLDQEAHRRNLPMTELVRQAVRNYRLREQSRRQPALAEALANTAVPARCR